MAVYIIALAAEESDAESTAAAAEARQVARNGEQEK
jgi:hypothetical protein